MGFNNSSPLLETRISKKNYSVSLPSDVLMMVFEDLNHTSPRKFSRLRLVSKQFDALVVPIMYRHLVLTKRVLTCFGKDVNDRARLQVAQDVRHHTKCVGIDNHQLRWPLVGELLRSLEDLRYLSWSTLDAYSSSIFDSVRKRWPDAKLALAASTYMVTDIMELPLPRLVSCKIVDNSKTGYLSLTAVEESVSRLLEDNPNLKRLHLVAGETLTHVNTPIPAIQDLVLERYDWQYDPTAVPLEWDLSKLTHLELKNMIIRGFVEQVTPDQLPHLRSFKTDSRPQYPDWDSRSLCNWIGELSSLESLEFRCDPWRSEYFDVIEKHALTLRTLEMPDDTSGKVDNGAWHWESAYKLLMITHPSLRLRQLTLSISHNLLSYSMNKNRSTYPLGERPCTTNILAQFRDLRSLTVVAHQPYFPGLQTNRERDRLTRKAACKFIEQLVTEKLGVQFEEVVIKMFVASSAQFGYYEERGRTHSTYTYEGGRHMDDTLSIREDMHEHSQQYAEGFCAEYIRV